jgi:signal transduction histidine kinase
VAAALAQRLPLRIRIDGPTVSWRSPATNGTEPGTDERRLRWRDPLAVDHGDWLLSRTTADGHRVTFALASLPRQDRPRAVGWATLGLLLLLTVAAYAVVRRLLRPLEDIQAGAVRFGAGDFSQPIQPRRNDELGELAAQINAMAAALEQRLDAKRQLLLAISHELRSPLTRARLNAELVEEGAARDALLRDLGEMRDLIVDLLESERLSGGHAALHTEPVDLNALVAEVVGASFAGRGIVIDLAPNLPTLALDATRLRLLLRNLIDNALRHGGDDVAPPHVSTASEAGAVAVSVRDFGPGVPEAQRAQLGEAFYRPDLARQRSTGGVGLGLHLCRLVAQAHGGRLELRDARPGLTVEVHLPS